MVPSANSLDGPAEEPHAKFAAKGREPGSVDVHGPGQTEFQKTERGGRYPPIESRSGFPPPGDLGRGGLSCLPEARALEAAVEIRGIVDPGNTARLDSRS